MNHTSAKAQQPRMLVRSSVRVVDPSFGFLTDFHLLLTVIPLSVTKRGALLFARKSR
jgi:hypothetical protein